MIRDPDLVPFKFYLDLIEEHGLSLLQEFLTILAQFSILSRISV